MNIRNSRPGGGRVSPLRYASYLGVLFLVLVATERPARAYADPGSGALLFQILAAAFVGALFYARKIIRWFRPKRKD